MILHHINGLPRTITSGKLSAIMRLSPEGKQIDTTLENKTNDFSRDPNYVGTMTSRELDDYIKLLQAAGI